MLSEPYLKVPLLSKMCLAYCYFVLAEFDDRILFSSVLIFKFGSYFHSFCHHSYATQSPGKNVGI